MSASLQSGADPVLAARAAPEWTDEADVVVAGSGAAGLVSALLAAECGARVIVLEKGTVIGGTTAKSAGGMWVPNNHHMRARGIEDPHDDAMAYMARTARPDRYAPLAPHAGLPQWEHDLIEVFYACGPAALESLEHIGGLRTMPLADLTNYYTEVDEDTVRLGRSLCPQGPDGEPADGPEMVRQLARAFERRGGRLLLEHRVVSAVIDEAGRVIGVVADAAGRPLAIRASRAVVFATGGFAHNPDLCDSHLPGPVFGGCAALTNEGDFVPIAQKLGAAMRNMNQAWNAPLVLERALRRDPALTSAFNIVGDGMLAVNRYGVRAMNEKAVYNEAVFAMFAWDGVRSEYPNLLMFPIWDQRTADAFAGTPYDGGLIPGPGADASHVVSGATLDELAAALDGRLGELAQATGGTRLAEGFAARLADTVERFNEFARSGRDLDFRRGDSLIGRHMYELAVNAARLGSASPSVVAAAPPEPASPASSPGRAAGERLHGRRPNRTMRPISGDGPYSASIIAPGTLDTKGGPMVNRHGQVLDHGGKPIAGLYAVGNCAGSPTARAYWGAGATLGPIVTLAWLAGRHAAGGAHADPGGHVDVAKQI